MQRARTALQMALDKIGIQLNPDKMQSVGPLAHRFPGSRPPLIDYLGALVSSKGSQTQAQWTHLRPKYSTRNDAVTRAIVGVPDDPDKSISRQCAFLLLRYVNITVSYVFTNSLPTLTINLRKEHAGWVRSSLEALIGLALTDAQWHQATLHDSQGGLGLPDWHDIAPLTHAAMKSLVTMPAHVVNPETNTRSIFDVVKTAQYSRMEKLIADKVPNFGPRARDMLGDRGGFRLLALRATR
jgi:hypothetical protein